MNAKQSCLNCDSTDIVALLVCFAPWTYWAVKWSQLLGRVCHAVVFAFADFICSAVVRLVQEFARFCRFLLLVMFMQQSFCVMCFLCRF